ncbi:unnamed protein product [Pocillopora meandrina]|uniref:Lysine-specific metallo-endopeptidase domain-containing protein n=1 Tax=Pocillopora meandrina TaxID=46732 RepID=A0AAU9XJG2_9CNID|nr:unnamed protein product [Pocillopora meandrina]
MKFLCILLILGSMESGRSAPFDISDTKVFSSHLDCASNYEAGNKIECKFHLKNNDQGDYSVLKWRTLLDGLRSNCLTVITNGEKLKYDSIYLKRSAPGPDQYLHVKPGQTVSSIFDVSDAYDMTKAGLYSIAVDTNLEIFSCLLDCPPSFKTIDKIECKFLLRNNGKQDYSVLKWRTPLDGLRSDCLTVNTNGKKLRYDGVYMKRSAPGPDQYLLVKPGQTVSSTFDISDAYDMTKAGLYSMVVDTYLEYVMDIKNNPQRAKIWFGKTFMKARKVFLDMKMKSAQTEMIYIFDGKHCKKSVFAYTYLGSQEIFLCKAFNEAETLVGFDTKAGIVIHELSHALSYRDDVTYGTDSCKKLAKRKAKKALKNADNYEYYVESAPNV